MKKIIFMLIFILSTLFVYSSVTGTWLVRKLSDDGGEQQTPLWSYGESVMSTSTPTWSYGRSQVHNGG